MGTQDSERLDKKEDIILIACVADQEVILSSERPFKPGFSYLLCFGAPFERLVVRAVVYYSHLMPGERRRYEIGLFLPDPVAGRRLAELDLVSAEPLTLLGYPKLLNAASDDPGAYPPELANLMAQAQITLRPRR